MISMIQSPASEPSDYFREQGRPGRTNNLSWLAELPQAQVSFGGPTDQVYLLLVGGTSTTAFRLRMAQSQLRHDLKPSHWSHAALVGPLESDLGTTPVYEISLEPSDGFGFPPPSNGVQVGRLDQYLNPRTYPNMAFLAITPQAAALGSGEENFSERVMTALERFKGQRSLLDAVEMTLQWLAYAWGTGHSDNPLLEGIGMPSAAMLEIVLGAAGFDLTPGLESRASCPEAIWQAAKWWYPYYERTDAPLVRGSYHIGHRL